MKICILSDSHDHRTRLRAAIVQAKSQGAQAVVHCGDVVAPSTLTVVRDLDLPVHVIHGNNTGDMLVMHKIAAKPQNKIIYHGQDATIRIADKNIFLVHYPHYARAMALTGDYDLVCFGHEHTCSVEVITNIKGTKTYLVNPGTVGGIEAKPTYLLGDLETMEFSVHQID